LYPPKPKQQIRNRNLSGPSTRWLIVQLGVDWGAHA
jgi:hypothetical protein